MIYTKMTKAALSLCFEAHKDQLDKSGMPYVFHPFHVAEQMTDEDSTIVALLHDLCKVNFYKVSFRNAKDESGKWVSVPFYTIEDNLPYGHGEKSVYIISGYMRLTRDEAFAIRYHMGFSGPEDANQVGRALEMFPLAYALCMADMEASYFLEDVNGPKKLK